jgi:protein-S-isoprenylcysteine O-methyltransferase Ste14
MALSRRAVVGRILYGSLFVVVLPVGLFFWARATEGVVGLPAFRSMAVGGALSLAGCLIMVGASLSLWRHGGGLPMNAYPPPRFVDQGLYGLVAHPIYLGFISASAGVSVMAGSASGLWLVTPAVAFAATALVVGYEGPKLRERFGSQFRLPRFHFPGNVEVKPSGWERGSIYLLVLFPWLVAYEAVQAMGIPAGAVSTHMAMEGDWPVLEWSTAIYTSVYLLVLLTPLVARTSRALRRLFVSGLLATGLVTVIYLTVPLIAPPRPFEPTTLLGRLLALEQSFNHTVAAFPAFHVLWALFAAAVWPGRLRVPAFAWAVAITVSCVTTGMHSLADIGAAILLFPLFHWHDRVWEWLRRGAETAANSWKEWRIGPVRILNHGLFGGLAMALGVVVAGAAVGPGFLPGGALATVLGLLGAAAWAQRLEGSPALLRPFGYYGSVLGVFLGIVVSELLVGNGWVLLGGFAVAAPWVQGVGRIRCLIQGCCHGGPAPEKLGIRYVHSRSRVTRLSPFGGETIYPTPLFSLLGNVVIGVLLLRLWSLGMPPTFVAGSYLLLSGFARFMEESYRAEPQTKIMASLHIYHWFAVGSVLLGAALTTIPATSPERWLNPLTTGTVAVALGMGLVAGFAMGVDFPGSNRRFSRLADVDGPPRLLSSEELRTETPLELRT